MEAILPLMTNDQDIQSGARQVEATEHMSSGLTQPKDLSMAELNELNAPAQTMLGELTLSMFQQGQSVRVRVGSATAAAEFYEAAFDSADEANSALLEAGVLTRKQVPNPAEPVGTGLHITGITAEQLLHAGLKRQSVSTL
jgi:hypothetical protein